MALGTGTPVIVCRTDRRGKAPDPATRDKETSVAARLEEA